MRTVEGDVVGDDSFFLDEPYGKDWSWDDLQWDYGAPVSALTFNDNTARAYHPRRRIRARSHRGRMDA